MSITEGAPSGAPASTIAPAGDPPAATTQAAPSAATTQQPAAAAQAAPGDDKIVRMSPEQLAKRLGEASESAQRKLLKDLGVDKPEDIRTALANLKALQDEKLSVEERTQKQLKEFEKAAEKGAKSATLAADAVNELFALLPAEQQAAIDEIAAGDPGERLKLLRLAKKLGPAPAPAAAAGAAAAATAAGAGATPPGTAPGAAPTTPNPPPPANLAPPPGAPKSSAQKTKYDEYQELLKAGDKKATVFFMLHERAINASAPPPS